jgi:hypothetical protein
LKCNVEKTSDQKNQWHGIAPNSRQHSDYQEKIMHARQRRKEENWFAWHAM